MTSFKQLKERAARYGLSLWETGGYYYLSGLINGEHTQGIFTNLRQIEKQLSSINKSKKCTGGRHITSKSKSDPTYSKEWSGVSYAPVARGKKCPKCGSHVHNEDGNFYCPNCDDYVHVV